MRKKTVPAELDCKFLKHSLSMLFLRKGEVVMSSTRPLGISYSKTLEELIASISFSSSFLLEMWKVQGMLISEAYFKIFRH